MDYTAGRGTTALSIVGTVLGSIGTAAALGGGIMPATNIPGARVIAAANGDTGSQPVSRYEMEQSQRIAQLESSIALRDANTYSDQKLLEVYRYFDGKLDKVNEQIKDVEVYQATNTATLSCMGGQIANLQAVLGSITKIVVPNGAVCPGWGEVKGSPVTETAAAS